MMIRELTQHIRIVPVGGPVTDSFDVMADRPFVFSPESDVDDAGVFWRVDKDIVIDTPDAAALRFFSAVRASKVCLWDSGGRQYVLGWADVPVRVRISGGLQQSVLHISGEMTWNPFG